MPRYEDIPEHIRHDLERMNETIAVKCKRPGCRQLIHVRFEHLPANGWYDLDCPDGHCHLYDSPGTRRRLRKFYDRQYDLRYPDDPVGSDLYYALCNS